MLRCSSRNCSAYYNSSVSLRETAVQFMRELKHLSNVKIYNSIVLVAVSEGTLATDCTVSV